MMAPVDAGALRECGHTIKYAGPEGPRKRTRPCMARHAGLMTIRSAFGG